MRFDLKASAVQRGQMLLEAGLAVTFTSAPELSSTYALDQRTVSQIQAVASDAANGLGLLFDAPVFAYPDKGGINRTFNSDQIQTLYKAMRDFTALVEYFAAGQIPSPPSPSVTVD